MPLKIRCPNCQKSLTVDDRLAGRAGKCPACSATFTVPSLSQPPLQAMSPAVRAELAYPAARQKSNAPVLIVALVGIAVVGAAVLGFALWNRGEPEAVADDVAVVPSRKAPATNATAASTHAATDNSVAAIEGQWFSEGVTFSPKFGKAAVLTIRNGSGEWREIETNQSKPVTKLTPLGDGTVAMVIDGTVWEAKRLLNDELEFRQQGKSASFFPNLKPYDPNHPKVRVLSAATKSKVPEISWAEALAKFGTEGNSPEKQEAFVPVNGAMMQVDGRVTKIEPTGYFYLKRDDHDREIEVHVVGAESAFHRKVRVGDQVTVRGKLVDYPGVVSPFTLRGAMYVRENCILGADNAAPNPTTVARKPQNPNSKLFEAPLKSFDDHPPEVLEALRNNEEVWLLRDFGSDGTRNARFAAYVSFKGPELRRVFKKFEHSPTLEKSFEIPVGYARSDAGVDLSKDVDENGRSVLRWQWEGEKEDDLLKIALVMEFRVDESTAAEVVRHRVLDSIVIDTVTGTWRQNTESLLTLKNPTREAPDGVLRNTDFNRGDAVRLAN